MRTNIRANTSITGGGLWILLLALAGLALGCVVNFSLRWVSWCNAAEYPFGQAFLHIFLVLVSAFYAALTLTGMLHPRRVWYAAAAYGVFMLSIPTLLFFLDYLIANMLIIFSMFHVLRSGRGEATEKKHVFFAAFFAALAVWFIPSAIVFFMAVYAGVLLFCPSDVRNWIIPLAGAVSVYILILTYEMVWGGGETLFPEISSRLFALPYTEKVFKGENFYFFAVSLAIPLLYFYLKYLNIARNDTVVEKNRFRFVTVMLFTTLLMILLWPSYKYLFVFFSLPFAAITAHFFQMESRVRPLFAWYLLIVSLSGLLFFK